MALLFSFLIMPYWVASSTFPLHAHYARFHIIFLALAFRNSIVSAGLTPDWLFLASLALMIFRAFDVSFASFSSLIDVFIFHFASTRMPPGLLWCYALAGIITFNDLALCLLRGCLCHFYVLAYLYAILTLSTATYHSHVTSYYFASASYLLLSLV